MGHDESPTMNQPMDDNEVRRYVEAFADGELDVEHSLRLLERMAMDPQTTKRVLHQQQLRQRTAKVMGEPGEAPASLRQQIEQMAQATPAPGQTPPRASNSAARQRRGTTRPGVIARLGRWMPAAAAALLLLVTVSIIGLNQQSTPAAPGADALLTSNLVDRFERRHVRCSQGVQSLYKPWLFPAQVNELPGALDGYFDRKVQLPAFDLSALGYEYKQAGQCRIPGRGAVHVLYRAKAETGRSDTLSLWMRPDDGRLELEAGRMYEAAGEDAPHPVLIWKQDGMVFHLVGDALDRVQHAAAHLRGEDAARG